MEIGHRKPEAKWPTAAFHRDSSDKINPTTWVKEDGSQLIPNEISRLDF